MLGDAVESNERPTRHIRFEPLERRELMASDFYEAASEQSQSYWIEQYAANSAEVSSPVAKATGLLAEGEATAAADLVAFAKALATSGAKFFGADWCAVCSEQKKLFLEGKNYLPFIESSNPDRTQNATGAAENIQTYPTWKFANGQVATGLQTLAQISTIS
ncbi:MAG: hypothetical protein ACOYOZ_07735, partial [Pirellula sp.]